MNAVTPKGWCPSLYEPMRTGDGLLVRVKPLNATLTSSAARHLAAAAMEHGNGVIELTSRGRIQVRGLREEATVKTFAAAMVRAGLADPDPETERRRCVVLAPLADAVVQRLAVEVEAALCRDPRMAALPAKFTVAIDSDDPLPLGDIGADIHVICDTFACSATLTTIGSKLTVSRADVPATVTSLALSSLEPARHREPPSYAPKTVGWLSCGAFGVGLPFGATTVVALTSLAELAESHGDGTLRITPWRAFIIPRVGFVSGKVLREAGSALGLITDPADARLAVVACPGRPACSSATVPARADAMRIAALRLPAMVHVSGCAKGCAHPAPAPITLVGENGRYGIVRDGGPRATPSLRDLTLAQVIAMLQA